MPSHKSQRQALKTYKFLRRETNEWEEVEPEIWQWEAYFEDGSSLKQFDDAGIFHQFAEIDQSKLVVFKMVSPQFPNSYTLLFDQPGMKLIHFYRNTILNAGTESESRSRLYCFGYERGTGKNKQKIIMAITPSNELIVLHDINIISVA